MIRTLLPALIGCALVPNPTAHASETLEISGYVQPALAARYRPEAVPQDQLNFGLAESKAGLRLEGQGAAEWSYNIYLYLTGEALEVLTHAIALDTDNDGNAEKIYTRSAEAAHNLLREAYATWMAAESLNVYFGRMSIPFTSQAQAADTELMFPNRASPNAVFLENRDLGGLASLSVSEGRLEIQGGLFNGTGEGVGEEAQTGVLYALRLDINPLGGLDRGETGKKDQATRYGFGLGLVARPYTLYDSAGYPSTGVTDLRGTASFRMTGKGLHLLTEGLARYETNTVTNRPEMAFGAYSQLGWYSPFDMEPVVRFGWTVEDYTFSPRHIYWSETGVNFYLQDRGSSAKPVRLGIHYLGEYRITERELAHGASAQVLVRF